jgi:predicted nuclease of predicted toxin-antitoxin system
VRLLFDENLAPRLVQNLEDCFPQSTHVRECGLQSAEDRVIWEFAGREGYAMVSKDADFRQRSFLLGHPPKVIWIRLGNCSTPQIEAVIRAGRAAIEQFGADAEQTFLGLG